MIISKKHLMRIYIN